MCIYSKSKISTHALRLSVFCFQNRLVTEPFHDKVGQFAADLCIVFIYFVFQHQLLKKQERVGKHLSSLHLYINCLA